MPRLLVVEDNAILATTLVRFLSGQKNLTVVAVAPTAEAAQEMLSELKVDLVLVDVSLPVMNGIDLVATLHAQYPELPCLILSGHNEVDYVGRALAAGVRGYVLKGNPRSIVVAIDRVLAGEIYLSEELQRKIGQLGAWGLETIVRYAPKWKNTVLLDSLWGIS